ncbi:MAG: transcriptional regulator [Bacteriovoracaceae bacterium]|nr:transcriptional regulator [Bacteriovoracaceae bacterium]
MEKQNLRRSQKKVITNEVTALKKMRELRGLSRKDAAPLVGVTFKLIEQLENGRVELTKRKIVQYCSAYGFSQKQYRDICEGKIGKIQKEICKVRTKIIEKNALRRSYKKIFTKEAKVLQVLRRIKKLTQDKASSYCGYSRATIGHIENGRIELSLVRIRHIVGSYGFTMKDFEYHIKSDVFVTDIQDDCISIIKNLSEEKLKAVYPLLSTFKN